MHNVQEIQKKTVPKQTGNWVFGNSIFAILADFAFEFWYKSLILHKEWYQKHISVNVSFSSKISMCGANIYKKWFVNIKWTITQWALAKHLFIHSATHQFQPLWRTLLPAHLCLEQSRHKPRKKLSYNHIYYIPWHRALSQYSDMYSKYILTLELTARVMYFEGMFPMTMKQQWDIYRYITEY